MEQDCGGVKVFMNKGTIVAGVIAKLGGSINRHDLAAAQPADWIRILAFVYITDE
jgi:hypothetical protein